MTKKKTVISEAKNGQQKNEMVKSKDMTVKLKELENELAKARSAAEQSSKQVDSSNEELHRL